jgi:PD-(D/E)XK nuclease superfamily
MLRIETPFSDEFEALIHNVIGCCITVHRALGPGLIESIYARAVRLELKYAGIPFEGERGFLSSIAARLCVIKRSTSLWRSSWSWS